MGQRIVGGLPYIHARIQRSNEDGVRELSVPERLGLFGVGVAGAAAVWPGLTGSTGLSLPCPLRFLTGVPCPACGLTTASVALAHGDPGAAAAANPAVFGLAALVAVAVPLLLLRLAGLAPAPVGWSSAARRRTGWVMALLASASWVFQLHRLDLV
jgi:hypothetical protein